MAKPEYIISLRDLADEARDVLAGRAEIARRAETAGVTIDEYLRARWRRRYGRALAGQGLSPHTIAECWYTAGCRDGGKFRLAVRLHWEARRVNASPPEVCKGDSLPWLRAYARGYRWLLRAGRSSRSGRTRYPLLHRRLARKAIAALGRLSAPLRYWAVARYLDGAAPWVAPDRIRIRDLDWAMVRRVKSALASGDAHAAAACLPVPAAVALLGIADATIPADERLSAALCVGREWARYLPLPLIRKIVIGVPPAEIAGSPFTRAEAVRWLRHRATHEKPRRRSLTGAPDRAEWLASERGLPTHRSLRVIAWMTRLKNERRLSALHTQHNLGAIGMIAQMGDPDDLHDDRDAGPQLRMPPEMPDGRPWPRIRLADILDEIQDADIVTGADSVLAVLTRVLERRREGVTAMQLQDCRPLMPAPPWARRLPRGMMLLNSPAALAVEGIAMDHCVGSYADMVRRGQCVLISIVSLRGARRSTLELSADGRTVRQHLGRRNAPPPMRHVALVRAWIGRHTLASRAAA